MKRLLLLLCIIFIYYPIYSQNNPNNKLPVIYMTGDFGYEYQEGTITLIMPDGTINENMKAVVKWRGGMTNGKEKHKRNYKIKFEENRQFFNMRNDNQWILDAGQTDLFRLRNRIATELWNDIATKPYYADKEPQATTGVRGQVVELYLNDEYRGIYCLTECMDRKELKLKKYDKNTNEIRGGLWKSMSYGSSQMWNVPSMYDNKKETWDVFEIKYPELNDVEETDYSTLWNAINFVANSSDDEFINSVSEYFDIPVIIDYYIFLNTLNAFDNVGKNMYWAVYDKTKDKKITLAVWDLDGTTGAKWLGDLSSPELDMFINHYLIIRLKDLNVDNFNEKSNERYHELRNTYLSTQSLFNRYYYYYMLLKNSGAAQREEEKWSGDTDVNGEEINFDKEILYIKDWINRHMTNLDTNIFPFNNKIDYTYVDNINNKELFNLYGQRITKVKPGIYISKGKKYIIR